MNSLRTPRAPGWRQAKTLQNAPDTGHVGEWFAGDILHQPIAVDLRQGIGIALEAGERGAGHQAPRVRIVVASNFQNL